MWFLSVIVRLPFTLISDGSEWWWFCSLVVISMWLCKEASRVYLRRHLDQTSGCLSEPPHLILLTLSPFPVAGHQPWLTVLVLSVGFFAEVGFVFVLAMSSLPSTLHTVPQAFLFPLCSWACSDSREPIGSGIYFSAYIWFPLWCSTGNAEDHRSYAALFAIFRDFGVFWARVCGEIQIMWQLLPSRFGNLSLSTSEGSYLSRIPTSWWRAVGLLAIFFMF